MNYTLDTAAIRRRFEQAIIGIRQDGTMAVLVETIASNWFDIVYGGTYNEPMVRDLFTTLIRPGERCEFGFVGDDRQWKGTYRGCRLDGYMFQSDIEITPNGFGVYSTIRPLPAAETETELDMATILSRIEAAEREIAAAKAALEQVHR